MGATTENPAFYEKRSVEKFLLVKNHKLIEIYHQIYDEYSKGKVRER